MEVSLDISREEELSESFPVLYDKSHNCFKEKDAVKNAYDVVAAVLGFIQTGNYFCFWLNPLVPGAPNLYPRYYLILSSTMF